MGDTVFSKAFNEVFKNLMINFEHMIPVRPDQLLNEMTMAQFTSLAHMDTDQSMNVASNIEELVKEYKSCLEFETQLLDKKRELFAKVKSIKTTIEENIVVNTERQKKLDEKCYDFLQLPAEKLAKQKGAQVFAHQQILPEPPVYSSRPIRQPPSASRKLIPTVSSTTKVNHEYSLDKSLLEESTANDTVQYEKVEKRLEFDDENDEDEDDHTSSTKKLMPPPSSSSVLKPKGNILSNSALFDIPSPPVYTSSLGKLHNKK